MDTLLWFVIAGFLIILWVLWVLLPFAIFGTKDKLDEIVEHLKILDTTLHETNKRLDQMKGQTTP